MSRDAVLFIHSTGTSPLLWAGVGPSVIGEREAIAPANLGYPPNPPVPRGERVTLEAEAAHVLRAVPEGAERVHVVAHSYGATVALVLAPALGARLASMFLAEPVLFGALADDADSDPEAVAQARAISEGPLLLHEEKGGGEEWLEAFVDYWNRPGSWSKMPDALRDVARAVGWKMFLEVRSCFELKKPFDAWEIAAPTTLVMGARTTVASRAMTRALARRRPNVTLVEMAGTGHMAPLTHPHLVHAELARHLQRLDATGAAPPA